MTKAAGGIALRTILGIDLGTSGTKTALFDETGRLLAQKTVEYPLYQPHNGWAEQDPLDWWNAVCEGAQAVLQKSGVPRESLVSVGLSGQMHGLVMLDKDGELLGRSIIWCDQRTGGAVEHMKAVVGEKKLIEITANPAMTGFTAAKVVWMMQNEPARYEKCRHILLPKDYIRYRLTGEIATEASDAAGTQLMDVPKRCWSSEVLSLLHIDASLMPRIYESPDVTGQVHRAASRLTGIPEGVLVVGGAADNSAAAIGCGVVRGGSAFTTIGTSGVVYAISDKVQIDLGGRVHTLCASIPGKYTVMSCTLSAGLSLRWLRDTVCDAEKEKAKALGTDPYELMNQLAASVPPGSDRLLFLPYLMGERCPHPDPDCRGVFFGLSAIHQKAHLIRAVMEGVAYSQAECVDVFRQMNVPVANMTVCGGGGKSALWRQILCDLYGCPVSTLQVDEGPALGAAILAGVGAKVFASVEEGADAIVKVNPPQLPIPENQRIYHEYLNSYSSLYKALKDEYKTLAKLQ